MRDGLRLVAIGLAAGLGAAVPGAGLIANFLFAVSARDPLTLAGAASILAGVALVACLIPAWRAAQLEPTVTMRAE